MQETMDATHAKWLPLHSSDDSLILHHYTTLSGLRGILNSRSLWCGHAYSLNDPLEIQYGRRIIQEALHELIGELNQAGEVLQRFFVATLRKQSDQLWGTVFHTFVASFCESGDLLSQWRAYADQGGGYSLGFEFSDDTRILADTDRIDLPLLNPSSNDRVLHPFLRKVIYDPYRQKELVRTFAEEAAATAQQVIEAAEKSPSHPFGRAFEIGSGRHFGVVALAMQAANVLYDMTLSFKHPAFLEEQEWRLIRVLSDDASPQETRFRESPHGLIPYRAMLVYDYGSSPSSTSEAKFPLREIHYGPTLDPLRTQPALALLLQHTSADGHAIAFDPHATVRAPKAALR